jgi:5-methylcytosine-specific restriction endonuclease McrA
MTVFLENKYATIYFRLIEKRRAEPLSKSDSYCESHHIIPKSLGGSNEKENLVNLTPREHFIAHRLLTKMTTGPANRSMWWALHRICFSNGNDLRNSRDYDTIRKMWAEWMRENHHSKRIAGWNEKMSAFVKETWDGDLERRARTSQNAKETHYKRKAENPESYYEVQRKNSKLGSKAIAEKWITDPTWAGEERKRISERTSGSKNGMYGKSRTEEQKSHQSAAISRKRWMHNETETVYVDKDSVEDFLQKGYKMGRNNYKRKEASQ